MKIKIIRDCFYKKKFYKEGEIIEADFNKKNLPSWAKIIEQKKPKQEVQKEEVQKEEEIVDDGRTPIGEEQLLYDLERLKDIAIEADLLIEVDENLSVKEQIEKFKAELLVNGIEF